MTARISLAAALLLAGTSFASAEVALSGPAMVNGVQVPAGTMLKAGDVVASLGRGSSSMIVSSAKGCEATALPARGTVTLPEKPKCGTYGDGLAITDGMYSLNGQVGGGLAGLGLGSLSTTGLIVGGLVVGGIIAGGIAISNANDSSTPILPPAPATP